MYNLPNNNDNNNNNNNNDNNNDNLSIKLNWQLLIMMIIKHGMIRSKIIRLHIKFGIDYNQFHKTWATLKRRGLYLMQGQLDILYNYYPRWDVPVHGRDLYFVKPTLGPPKKFQDLTRADEVVITRLRIGHTKATKSHILPRGPPTACHHCGQTLTIEHMLLECAVLQECHDEYYTVDSLNALFETIPETCIVEFLREAGFFYLIWCDLLTSTGPRPEQYDRNKVICLENEGNSGHIYSCRTANMSWRTCVVVKQTQCNYYPRLGICHGEGH